MDDNLGAGAFCGVLIAIVFAAMTGECSTHYGKRLMFRDIANQRCAPQQALISADDHYRYVCVDKAPH
jgi:hypothetical protein